jgi:hypothetical protein
MDDVVKYAKPQSELGFVSGTWLGAGGEKYGPPHVQIGTMAPAKLALTVMRYHNAVWNTLNVDRAAPPFPYGSDIPGAGQFRDWTVAH